MALWKMSTLKTLAAALAALALLTLPVSAFAAYGQLKAPLGWSPPKSIGTVGTFKTGPSANSNTYKGSTVLTNAALEIGGQAVQVPVSMRIAANASVIAATYAFGNPAIFAALAVGSAAYLYYQQKGLTVENGIWIKQTDGTLYMGKTSNGYFSNAEAGCRGNSPPYDAGSTTTYTYDSFSDHGSTVECAFTGMTAAGDANGVRFSYLTKTVGSPERIPVGDPEFHSIMDPVVVPKGVPKDLPGVDWPYEQPAINPSPADIPDVFPSPASPPASKPVWVPTGDPVKNPTTTNPDGTPKPDTWTQPGKDVKPAGTPTDPWRVDVTDAPKTKGDPSPNTDTSIPTTTTPTPTDFQTCGLPGKPKCLIDETGTPTYDPKKLELDKATLDPAASSQRDKVSAPGDKNSIFQGFSQFFSLPPLAACTPVVMPSIAGQQIASMDVCPGAEWLRGLMGFVWAVAGFLFVFRTVEDVI